MEDLCSRAGARVEDVREVADVLRGKGRDAVVLWAERQSGGERGRQGVGALLGLARALGLADGDGGLIEVPAGTNARGLREVGCAPGLSPRSGRRPRGRQ